MIMLYLVPPVLQRPTPQRGKERTGNKGAASLFLKDNEICTETGHAAKSSK